MTVPGSQPEWFKSSYSTGQNNCVEIRTAGPHNMEIQDSKTDYEETVFVTSSAFRALIGFIRN